MAKVECDRVIIMYAGKLMEIGMTDQIYHEPLHPYTEGLIAAVPSLENRHTKSISGIAPTPLNWPSGCPFHPRCPKMMDICRSVEPKLTQADKDRQVWCHLYGDEGEGTDG